MEEIQELVQQLAQKVSSCCERRDFDRARHWLSKATAVAERTQNISVDKCVADARSTLAKHVARADAEASEAARAAAAAAVQREKWTSHPAAREAKRIKECTFVTRSGDCTTNFYSVFQVERTATLVDIKLAYRRLSLILHPDRAEGVPDALEVFKIVTAGFDVLKTPLLRGAHDARIDGDIAKAKMLEARHKQLCQETKNRDDQTDQEQTTAREAAAAAAAAREAAREAAAAAAAAAAPARKCVEGSGVSDDEQHTPKKSFRRDYPRWYVIGARVVVFDFNGERLRGTVADPPETNTEHGFCWVRLDVDGYVHGYPFAKVRPTTSQPKRAFSAGTPSAPPPSKRPRRTFRAKKKKDTKRKSRMRVDDSSDEASFTDGSDTSEDDAYEAPKSPSKPSKPAPAGPAPAPAPPNPAPAPAPEPAPKPVPPAGHEPATGVPKTHEDVIQSMVDKCILAEDVAVLKKFVRLVPRLTVPVQDLAKNRGKLCVPLAQVLAHESVEVAEKMLKFYVSSARAAVVAENELGREINLLDKRRASRNWHGETKSTVTELYNALDIKFNVAVTTGLKDTSALYTKAAATRYDLKMQIFRMSA